VVKVQAGEVISEYQALQALLIASANNFADILANWAFGSSSKYLDYANQYVQSHGMNSTTINDTSGFSTSTVSNSNNLEILGQKAITNPVIANIVDQYTAIIPVAGKIVNYNFNLNPSSKSQINGIKTGNTSAGGGNYIYSTDYLGYKLVGSIVNAPNLNDALDEAPAILNSYEKLINNKTIVSKDQVVGYYSLPWGNKIQVYSNKSILVPVEPNTKYKIDLKLGNYIPSKQISDYIVVSNNSVSIKYPLTIQNNYTNPSIWWRINYSFKKMF
jgi:D-alanyl-D-alanine carboxypeptidase (penicillin-binding protein 5/6)